MSLSATGAYLKYLREVAGISRLALSKKVDTSDSQIIRIEQGQETRGSLLAKIIKEIDANPDDVIELLISDEYIVEDGINRAKLWVEKRKPKSNGQVVIHPDVQTLVSRMTEYELGRWVALGERMIEERNKAR
jgi:transcriptional regulator with XRE-family HTH domain